MWVCLTEYRNWIPQVEDVPAEVRKAGDGSDSKSSQTAQSQVCIRHQYDKKMTLISAAYIQKTYTVFCL